MTEKGKCKIQLKRAMKCGTEDMGMLVSKTLKVWQMVN